MGFASLLLVSVHILIAYSNLNAIFLLLLQGIAYCSFASAFWPAITMTVEEHFIGLSFGIASSMQNIGLAIVPLLVAAIYSNSGYKYVPNVEILFAVLSFLSLIVLVLLRFKDSKSCDILNSLRT